MYIGEEEANQRSPHPRRLITPDSALCFIERRGTRAGLQTIGGCRVRIPDMYKGTLIVLHYSEGITQMLRWPLEEKYLRKEQCIPTCLTMTDWTEMCGTVVSQNYAPTNDLPAKEQHMQDFRQKRPALVDANMQYMGKPSSTFRERRLIETNYWPFQSC
jgi:hypothetical protein